MNAAPVPVDETLARRYEAEIRRLVFERLRTYDRDRMLAIAAGGGPRTQADRYVVYCPLCSCNKNGYADEPNTRTEACEDERCLCHAVEDEPRPATLAAFDRELNG